MNDKVHKIDSLRLIAFNERKVRFICSLPALTLNLQMLLQDLLSVSLHSSVLLQVPWSAS